MAEFRLATEDIDKTQYMPNRTTKQLTKYEKARILGIRALQISQGAPVKADIEGSLTDPLLIAEAELKSKNSPIIIRRPLPDGTFEEVAVRNLDIDKSF